MILTKMLALVLVSARNFKILFLKENSQGVRSRFWQMWLESFLVKGRHKPLLLLLFFFFFFQIKESKEKERLEKRLLEELFKMFMDSDSFYYSLTYDLTNSVQRQSACEKTDLSLWRKVSVLHCWPAHLKCAWSKLDWSHSLIVQSTATEDLTLLLASVHGSKVSSSVFWTELS